MNCHEADNLIDLRVQDLAEAGSIPAQDWSRLDEHLTSCPKCKATFRELLRTHELVAALSEETPTDEERAHMLAAIQADLNEEPLDVSPNITKSIARFTAAAVGIAAVLGLAFTLGEYQYHGTGLLSYLTLGTTSRPPLMMTPGFSQHPPRERVAKTQLPPLLKTPDSLQEGYRGFAAADEDGLDDQDDAYNRILRGGYVSLGEPVDDMARFEEGTEVAGKAIHFGLAEAGEAAAEERRKGAAEHIPARATPSRVLSVPTGGTDASAARRGRAGFKDADLAAGESITGGSAVAGQEPVMAGTELKQISPTRFGERYVEDAANEKLNFFYEVADAAADRREPAMRGGRRGKGENDEKASAGLPVIVDKYEGIADEPAKQVYAGDFVEGAQRSLNALLVKPAGMIAEQLATASEELRGIQEEPPTAAGAARADRAETAVDQSKATSAPQTPPRPQTRIIKTGELSLEVETYETAVEKVADIVGRFEGYVADASTQEQTGGALLGRVVIRVSPERFDALFAELKSLGHVESENAKAADVTAEYVDLEARIHSHQVTEARLQQLVEKSSLFDKVSALLEVERELNRVRSEIEQLQGQLRVMADRVALSTIVLLIREPARTVPSGSLAVEVQVLEEAGQKLDAALEELGGRLISGKTSRQDNGSFRGEYQIEVSLAGFGDLLQAISTLGRVKDQMISDRRFADASAPWASDVRCRLTLVMYEQARDLPAADIALEIDKVEEATGKLDALLEKCSGSVTSNQVSRQDDGSQRAELKLSIPAGKFPIFLESIGELGRITHKQVAGAVGQVVGGAAAYPCDVSLTLAERSRQVPSGSMVLEVARFEAARQQLSTIVAEKDIQVLDSDSGQSNDGAWAGRFRLGIKASGMESAVARIETLGRVERRQIQGLGLGDLSRMDADAVGVIEVILAEKPKINPAPTRAGGSIRAYLRDGLAGLYTSLGLILFGLITLAPWLFIVILLTWLITSYVRRRRRHREAKAAG